MSARKQPADREPADREPADREPADREPADRYRLAGREQSVGRVQSAGRVQPVDLGILLGVAYQEFVRELHAAHATAGFTDLGRSDGFVFRSLAIRPMTVSELAGHLEITKQGAAQIIDDMERRGYVERQPDPDDRRARLVRLSERGQRALANARRFHRDYERRLARVHGKEAIATLRAMLEAIAGAEQSVDPRLRAFYL